MEKIAPLGAVYQAGTLSGNPVAVTAGIETLKLLKKGVYKELEKKSGYLAEGIKGAAKKAGCPAYHTRVGSILCTFFTSNNVIDYASAKTSDTKAYARFFFAMLQKGINLAPSQFEAMFLSTAHTEREIERTIKAAYDAFKAAL
mgnify:FL=1